jgi:hypothetical protein
MRSPPPHLGRPHPCPVTGCNRHFRNRSGLTKHVRIKHTHSFPVPRPLIRNASPPPADAEDLVDPLSSPPQAHTDLNPDEIPDNHSDADNTDCRDDRPSIVLHPYLNGKLTGSRIRPVLISIIQECHAMTMVSTYLLGHHHHLGMTHDSLTGAPFIHVYNSKQRNFCTRRIKCPQAI